MRHLEAAAIALAYAFAAVYMAALAARQAAPVHHVGAQRALAWALLNAQDPRRVSGLLGLALSGARAQVLAAEAGDLAAAAGQAQAQLSGVQLPVCYSAALYNATTGGWALVTVCAGP